MLGIFGFFRRLFSGSSSDQQSDQPPQNRQRHQQRQQPQQQQTRQRRSGEGIIRGTTGQPGVATVAEELTEWVEAYTTDYQDYLTLSTALARYQRAQSARERLDVILQNSRQYQDIAVDAAETLAADLDNVMAFVESREQYNDEWMGVMRGAYEDSLNSYFDEGLTHTDQQLEAIFTNDDFNRVNAAAGTGKTTTFGRRVNFILEEFDDLKPSDLIAVTFTRNGANEMQTELEDTFQISGVETTTINSYSKRISEAEYDDLEFIVGEARTTEIADIWRSVRHHNELRETYEAFMEAWKEDQYNPNDANSVEGMFGTLSERSNRLLGDEEVELATPPEEGLAQAVIAEVLMKHGLKYDYQVYLDWAHSASEGFVLDFRVRDDSLTETVYIEYHPSQPTQDARQSYHNTNVERPGTIQRIFEENDELETDVSDKIGVVVDGDEVLDRPSTELDWERPGTRSRFEAQVREALLDKLAETPLSLDTELSRNELADFVYDHKTLESDVVSEVEEFIQQARVREWDPEQAEDEVESYLASTEDVDEGVPEFSELALATYRQFRSVFDNETKTDFMGSVVLTRDLLAAGRVEERNLFTYILVDEMQDLNQIQFGMVRELAAQKSDSRVFGVGDDWQSIFGFQGARPDLFIEFGESLGADTHEEDGLPDPVTVFTDQNPMLADYDAYADTRLESNFRCPETVVAASNAVIRNNEIRTDKNPTGSGGGQEIQVHHLGCDTFAPVRNRETADKVGELVKESPHDPAETDVLVRSMEGDSAFIDMVRNATPDGVTIQTAHNSKGSEAEHIIIPKVSEVGGYPSVKSDRWTAPVKQPPEIYEKEDADYALEEERRLFYVALTRTKDRLDIITVQGAESLFIEELPDQLCEHHHPLSTSALETIDQEGEARRDVTGDVKRQNHDKYISLDWNDGGVVTVNLWDATDEQYEQITSLAGTETRVTIENCGIQLREANDADGGEADELQLQLDGDASLVIK